MTPRFGANIGMLSMVEETKASMVLKSALDERDAQFSPDAGWLAYQPNESGRLEVYVRRVGGDGPRTRVSSDGGGQARWRADGLEIFYLSLDGELMSVPLKWTAGADGLRASAPVPLFRAPVGPVQGVALHHYIPSASGDRFLYRYIARTGRTAPDNPLELARLARALSVSRFSRSHTG